MKRNRGFEIITAYKNKGVNLPKRATKKSAGYDFEAVEDITIPSLPKTLIKEIGKAIFANEGSAIEYLKEKIKQFKPTLVPTGIKAYMQDDEVLMLYNRSSNPLKKGLIMGNSVGVIDADYYNNPDNEGHIYFQFFNILPFDIKIKKGDRIGQGVFQKFLKVDNDNTTRVREGGLGSTDKK